MASNGQAVQAEHLGNVIGGARYFGSCPSCGSQHMSTHDRVFAVRVNGCGHAIYCGRCREAAEARAAKEAA